MMDSRALFPGDLDWQSRGDGVVVKRIFTFFWAYWQNFVSLSQIDGK